MDKAKVKSSLEQALMRSYWEKLIPGQSVCDSARLPDPEPRRLDPSLQGVSEAVRTQGWFALEGFFPPDGMKRMADCILALDRAGWLPIYCFVYDEFWDLLRGPGFRQLMTQLVGPDYFQKLAVWAHLVKPVRSSHGWPPHVDYVTAEGEAFHADGSPRLLSVWIPLTDATVDNGCMYLVPMDRVPPRGPITAAPIDGLEARHLLQSTQALPLPAGAIAGWRQDILHWGSFSSNRARAPRISLALEFQSASQAGNPMYPLIDGSYIPSTLEERLLIIGNQVLRFLNRWEKYRSNSEHIAIAETLQLMLKGHGAGWIQRTPAAKKAA